MSNVPPIPQAPQAPPPSAKPTEPKEGRYKGRALTPEGVGDKPYHPHEFGLSTNQKPELLVHLFLADLQRTYVSPLYFSKDAAPYSEERLRALGCTDLATLAGIDTNEVDVDLSYNFYEGAWKLRVQILSGGGVFHTSNPVAGGGKEFAAIVAATLGRPVNLSGGEGGGTNGSTSSGAPKPPF